MKTRLLVVAAVFLFSATSFSQEKSNDDITRQIRFLGVDHVNVTFDASSNMSKLMAVAENFSNRDADSAGVQAINFAMGFFYPGQSLKQAPESVHFTFWILTRKPRFAENHRLTVELDGRTLDLGDARYAAKPAQNMEYLNFDPSRADLAAIGSASKVVFHIGEHTFSALPPQIRLILATAKLAGGSDLH
jgi:hypothetical protein